MTDAPLPDSSITPSPSPGEGSIFGPVHLTRAIIIVTCVLCAILFYYAARWIGWPSEPGFSGSMAQSKSLLAFVVAIGLLVVCTFLGTILAGRRWFLAGLLAAAAGLATWAVRGGTMTPVLFNAQNSGSNQGVFIQMLGELVVFFGVIGALWNLVWNLTGRASLNSNLTPEARSIQAAKLGSVPYLRLFAAAAWIAGGARSDKGEEDGRSTPVALVVQTAIMLIIMMLLVVTPMKKQVLTSIFLAAMTATAIAEGFFADRKAGRWFWVAPLLVGVIGYAAGYFAPTGLETGDLQGAMAPLARVLPLDYASMGCVGVLVGYWWMEPDPADSEADEAQNRPETKTPGNSTGPAIDA